MKKIIALILFNFFITSINSQTKDSLSNLLLKEIPITENKLEGMPDVKDNVIYAGKKTKLFY